MIIELQVEMGSSNCQIGELPAARGGGRGGVVTLPAARGGKRGGVVTLRRAEAAPLAQARGRLGSIEQRLAAFGSAV